MKRLHVLLIMVAIVIAVFVVDNSLSEDEKIEAKSEPKIIKWNLGSEPATLDPQLTKDLYGGSVINHLFEGLFRYRGHHIEPAIAERYDMTADGLTYTFYLKETKWSDGQPLTARDFEYSWKRALDPTTGSEYAFQFHTIAGGEAYHSGKTDASSVAVKAIDDLTLQVTLSSPTPYFLDLLTTFPFMPVRKEIVEQYPDGSWAIDPAICVSNGPYILTEFELSSRLKLTKNANYWNTDAIKIDMLEIGVVNDANTALTGFEAGDFDIIDSVPLAEISRLKSESPEFYAQPSLATAYYLFNTTVKPLDNPDVRKALSYAIDRKALVEMVTKGGEIAATGFIPPGLYDADDVDFHIASGTYGINPDEVDIALAKSLLATAGFPDGVGFPKLEILYNTSETNAMIAAAIQEMWKVNLGIDITLSNQEFAVFQESKKTGNYQISRGSWFADYADPMAMLEIWTSASGINTTGWSNSEYDQLIDSAKTSIGQRRFDALHKAQDILMNEMPIIPLFYYSDLFMISEKIIGWEKTAMGVWYFGNADLLETE